MNEYVTALDLGSTKVCAIVAEVNERGAIRIIGHGVAPSDSIVDGTVINIPKTAAAIAEAVKKAELISGIKIRSVHVGVAGEHIRSMRHRNFIAITNSEHEIKRQDILRLDEDIRGVKIPRDMQILHVIPEEYIIDTTTRVTDPVGFTASKLEAMNHLVLASENALENIKKSVNRAGLEVGDFVLQPLASAAAILDNRDKEVGVLMLDIGGGTTDMAVVYRKAIIHTKVFGIAGNNITDDIRNALRVTFSEAEEIKKRFGCAIPKALLEDEEIVLSPVGAWGNTTTKSSIVTEFIYNKMRSMFRLVDAEIESANLRDKISAGVIITGGGALLKGTCELAQEVFGLPARMGIPLDNITGNNPDVEKPEYATALGLLLGAPGQVSKENEPMVIKEVSEEELKTESSKKTVTDTTENKKQETGWFSRLSKKYTSDKKPTSKDEGSFGTNLKEIWKNLKRIGHEL